MKVQSENHTNEDLRILLQCAGFDLFHARGYHISANNHVLALLKDALDGLLIYDAFQQKEALNLAMKRLQGAIDHITTQNKGLIDDQTSSKGA